MTAFTNYLSPSAPNRGQPYLKDYQHANRLYVTDTYARSPKVGFLYFIQLNINESAVIDKSWSVNDRYDVGLLAKKADLPKFNVSTETLNQYNRKTIVQTKLTYSPITIDFHDDNSNITHNLWVNYNRHYYADSNYGDPALSKINKNNNPEQFSNTKYGDKDYKYGRYDNGSTTDFFKSIDLYVLHQGEFTQYTLINPKITEWSHDSVNQAEGSKIQQNRMTVAYEAVIYKTGVIQPSVQPEGWIPVYYDNEPSPLTIGGNPRNTPNYVRQESSFDKPGPARVYGLVGGESRNPNPLLDIGTILAKNYLNKNGLGKAGPVGYTIAAGVLGTLGGGPGKYASPPPAQNPTGVFTLPGGIGINIFKGFNTSVDGKIRANPAAIILPPRR